MFKFEFDCYNERRYSRPWGALVTVKNNKIEYDFNAGSFDGDYKGGKGNVRVQCEPGDIVAVGQKDRRGNGTTMRFFVINHIGEATEIEKNEVVDRWEMLRAAPATEEVGTIDDEPVPPMYTNMEGLEKVMEWSRENTVSDTTPLEEYERALAIEEGAAVLEEMARDGFGPKIVARIKMDTDPSKATGYELDFDPDGDGPHNPLSFESSADGKRSAFGYAMLHANDLCPGADIMVRTTPSGLGWDFIALL